MSAVEQSVPVAQTLQREGVPGLWQQITAKIGDLKEMILGKIKDFLVPTVLIAGIMWIVSLLNPASAFVKAVKAIIDIVRFIFERGAQLVEFVNSVLDAIIAIAGGAIGGAAKLVETALAKSIPVLIGFLAALLGIGGLANKVKGFFQALSKPVMKAVDTVVGFIVKAGKKLWAKLKSKFGKKDRGAISPEDERKHQRLAAKAAGELKQQPSGPNKDYVRVRSAKLEQAKQIEQTYTPQLRPGIKLSVRFESPEKDKGDQALDFQVAIAPNTTKVSGKVPFEGDPKDAELEKLIQELVTRAKQEASTLTPMLKGLAAASGGRMAGLRYKVKTPESLRDKIQRDLLEFPEGIAVAEMGANVSDVLRYTMIFSLNKYKAGHDATLTALQAAGHRIVVDPLTRELKDKNFWKKIGTYKGYNTQLISPGGQRWELQFHTDRSFRFKGKETHDLYEELRHPDTPPERKAEIKKQLTEMASKLKVPPGVLD